MALKGDTVLAWIKINKPHALAARRETGERFCFEPYASFL